MTLKWKNCELSVFFLWKRNSKKLWIYESSRERWMEEEERSRTNYHISPIHMCERRTRNEMKFIFIVCPPRERETESESESEKDFLCWLLNLSWKRKNILNKSEMRLLTNIFWCLYCIWWWWWCCCVLWNDI